jgi:soluble lytic murein transglycosylase-like protein
MVSIILSAAKAAKVSGALLLAICTTESHLKNVKVPHDGGSPSYGICQIKYETAKQLGFKGQAEELMNPKTNAEFAAKYLAYQESRYGTENWCLISAAYNAGSFNESDRLPGHPKNLKYVRKVQKNMDPLLHYRMVCVQ